MQPLGLPIRSARAIDVGAFIPGEPEPPQITKNCRVGVDGGALHVGVLDPQNERAALPAREEPVEERRARVAHVQLPGRTRSESHTHVCVS